MSKDYLSSLYERRDMLMRLKKDEPNNSYNDWDKKINSIEEKIEIAETYQQGQIDAIEEFAKWLDAMGYLNRVDVDYDWDENPYETTYTLTAEEVLEEYKQMKEEQSGETNS